MDDVIIVGAGPAGSTLGRLLAEQGVSVRLLDASRFPRDKPCGESLSPGAVAALERLGGAPPGAAVRGWAVSGPGCGFTGLFPTGHRGLCCERRTLDGILLARAAAAGVAVGQGIRVTGLMMDRGKACGVYGTAASGRRFWLPARIVVGADGIRSVISRCLGLLERGRLRKLAFTAHFDCVEGLGDLGEIHLGQSMVIGLAPLGAGRANLTVVIPAHMASMAAGNKTGFTWRALSFFPQLRGRFSRASMDGGVLACGPFDLPIRRAAVPGALLAGDAAGYYDPLTGQGIYRALRCAELAAPAMLSALDTGRWDALYQYDRRRRQEFKLGTWLQQLIEFALGHPSLLRGALQLLRWRPLGTWLVARVGDCPKEGAGCRQRT